MIETDWLTEEQLKAFTCAAVNNNGSWFTEEEAELINGGARVKISVDPTRFRLNHSEKHVLALARDDRLGFLEPQDKAAAVVWLKSICTKLAAAIWKIDITPAPAKVKRTRVTGHTKDGRIASFETTES